MLQPGAWLVKAGQHSMVIADIEAKIFSNIKPGNMILVVEGIALVSSSPDKRSISCP